MPFEWFVALRYLRRGPAQTALILGAVSVGVAVLVFLSALIDGLQANLIRQTLGSQAHVTLRPVEEQPRPLNWPGTSVASAARIERAPQRMRSIDQWPRALDEVRATSGVVAATPSVTGAAFALRGLAQKPVVVRGVEPLSFLRIVDVVEKLRAGRFSVSGDDVVIGAELARLLDVSVGDKLRLSAPTGRDDLFTVAGIFDLGNKEANARWALVSLRHAQTLFDLPGGASDIDLTVTDVFAAEDIARTLSSRTGLEAESWMQRNAQLLVGLRSQNSSKYMIQFFVMVAVTLGIASVLIVSVVQKSREIGILRAVGVSRAGVMRIFLIQGAVLGLWGSLLGSLLGAGLSVFFQTLARNPDGSPTFPVDLRPALFAGATGLATAIGLLAAVLPARRAARLDPATVIRNG